MQRVIIFGLLFGAFGWSGRDGCPERTDSALGAWTLNHAKSTFSGAVPYRRVMKFEVAGDAIKETTFTMSTDKPSIVVESTARFDGNDYPISNSVLNTVSVRRVDDQTVERTGKIQGTGRGDGNPNRFGQGQGADGHDQGHQGRRGVSSVQVYDRQPG